MSDDSKLPRELVWEGAHLSELALTSIADGQEHIVEPAATAHAAACDWCAGRLGRAALLSEAVGHAVAKVRPSPSRAPARVTPAPWSALGIGMVVSLLAALPSVSHLGRLVEFVSLFCSRGVPVLARGGFAMATSEPVTAALPAATLAAAALLVAMGLVIATTRSRAVEGSAS